MMKQFAWVILFLLLTSYCGAPENTYKAHGEYQVNHDKWTQLVQTYVDIKGMVDYQAFAQDREELRAYLNHLEANPPAENWSREQKLAYWINAYNAYTIELVLRHYPLESIKDIGSSIQVPFVNTPWDIKFIEIGDNTYDLNNIEHGIIRKEFEEPRIHFALVCAAVSCPRLRTEAYEPEKLDQQLDEETEYFINQSGKNEIGPEQARLSKLFSWYSGDFKDVAPSVTAFINRYSEVKITKDTDIEYVEYDWALNEQQ